MNELLSHLINILEANDTRYEMEISASNGTMVIYDKKEGKSYKLELSEMETEDDEDYTPSSTNGDYSPSNPWDAPGMSIHDFI